MKGQSSRAISRASVQTCSTHHSRRKCSGEAFALNNSFSETFGECFAVTNHEKSFDVTYVACGERLRERELHMGVEGIESWDVKRT